LVFQKLRILSEGYLIKSSLKSYETYGIKNYKKNEIVKCENYGIKRMLKAFLVFCLE
jgi:hypothetical protein